MNVCVLMFSNLSSDILNDNNYIINKKYCDTFNYNLIKSNHNGKNNFERINFILSNIVNYDYIIFLDTDTHFYIDCPPIINVINSHIESDFIFSRDIEKKNNNNIKNYDINIGIFIIKNSLYSINILNHWHLNYELYQKRFYFDKNINIELGILHYIINNNVYNILNHSTILDYNILQRFNNEKLQIKNYGLLDKPFVLNYNDKNLNFKIINSTDYLNNISSQIIFFHIEKCGGESLKKSLFNYFINIYKNDEILTDNYDFNYFKYKVILTHVSFKSIFNDIPFKITIIRNPLKRLISHYHYFDYKIYKYNSLIDFFNNDKNLFLEYICKIGNLQTIRLTNLSEFFFEHFRDNKKIISYNQKIINLIKSQINKLNYVIILEKVNYGVEKLNILLNNKYNINNDIFVEHININSSNYLNLYKNNKKFFKFVKKYLIYDYILYNECYKKFIL